MEVKTDIVKITNMYDSKKTYGKFTDVVICIKQKDNIVILQPNDLIELEKVIGAKFRC
jgi:hypothetical protein